MAFWDRIKKISSSHPGKETQANKADPCEEKEFVPRYQAKKINVFVSSTFKDMKAERDELTLRVFPALRKICEERAIAWGEVDLRWGIPEEKKGEVLSTCLKFIDECRPHFIGMLGERYGWVEETVPEVVTKDYPWITNHKGKSITELEILHGVLNNPAMAGHAYFYFRDPAYIKTLPESQQADLLENPTEQEISDYGEEDAVKRAEHRKDQLVTLKKRIKESSLPYHENYHDPVEFGDLVREDLMRVIDSLAPVPKPLTDAERASVALDRIDTAHEAFAASRFGVYIPRQEYFDRLDAHVVGDSPPLVVLGKSGSGKSALLAHWAFRYRLRHPDDLVLVHFVGASSDSTDWTDMLRRFMGEFKRKFYLTEEIPVNDDALMAAFRNWLSMAAAHGRVVLVIDALNQLEDRNGAPDMVWLPPTVPGNIRLIVSTLAGRPLDAIRKRGWPTLDVEPLTVSERNALITCYLKKYHKELSLGVKDELASAPQSENPLFLRALLEEVRIHGVFEKLVDQIRNYLTAQTVDALYEMILARYERDYERDRPGLVKETVSLIWAARQGLSIPEMMDLLGTDRKPLPAAYWAPLYLALEHSLVEKDGRITFFHDYLRTAVTRRYLLSEETKRVAHRRIADYFALQPDSSRRIEELPWQLAEAAEWDRLVALLTEPLFFLAVWQAREYDVKRNWVQIEAGSAYRMGQAYRPIILEPAQAPLSLLLPLCGLLHYNGHLDEASALGEYLIQSSKEYGNDELLQLSLGNQASILDDRGDLDEAMKLYEEQERICRELGNFNSLQSSLNNQALILKDRGDLDGAMTLYKEQERICRELGNINSLQTCLGNQANIHYARGDLDGAMTLYKKQEQICRELGNIDSLQRFIGNQALIIQDRGDLNGAMDIFKEQEQICRELGYVDLLQISLGNQALNLYDRGDLDGAMALLKEKERICRELGNIDELQKSLGNQGNILCARGDLDGAMTLYKEQERISRELGHIDSLQHSLGNQGNILNARGNLDDAIALLKEQERICQELGNVQGLSQSLFYQARVLLRQNRYQEAVSAVEEAYRLASSHGYVALAKKMMSAFEEILSDLAVTLGVRGDLDEAMALLKEQERICRELGNNDGLSRSLGNQANILVDRGDQNGAMALLKEQERICRELGNINSLQTCLGNQANILYARGDLNGAMALHKEEERICRELGNNDGLSRSLCNQALILHARGDLNGAMALLKEQERICRELGNNDGLSRSFGNQGLILYARGDLNGAMVLHKEQERICRELGTIEGLVISLRNQALILVQQKRHREALKAAEEAYNLASGHGYTALAKQILLDLEKIRKGG